MQFFFTIIMLAHCIPFAPSCFSNTLSLCNGPKVDTFIPIWASSQPYCKIVMKLIPNIPNCNWRPSLNESCPYSFFNGPLNCPFNNNQGFSCPFGLFFSHLHCLISSALAITFDCIMFKYFSRMTTCDML